MDITVQNQRLPAKEKDGRYYHVFTPKSANEKVKIHHLGCVGDTFVSQIQLEEGTEMTSFVEPKADRRPIEGLFKDFRDLKIEMTNPESAFWAKIQANVNGAITEFGNRTMKSTIAQSAKEIVQQVKSLETKTESSLQVLSNSISQKVSRSDVEGIINNSGDNILLAIKNKGSQAGNAVKSALMLSNDGVRLGGNLVHITGNTLIDKAVIKSGMVDKLTSANLSAGIVNAEHLSSNSVTADKIQTSRALVNKLISTEGFFETVFSKKLISTYIQAIDLTATQIKSGILKSLNGTLYFDLDKNRLVMTHDDATIRRESKGYPTQFIRYENDEKTKTSRTIIGSNRNGTDNFNSVSFAGLVVENNSLNEPDRVRVYGDTSLFRHAQGEVGWNLNAVTQNLTPATWAQNSEVWARHFVVPKTSKSDTDNPSEFVRLEASIAALWNIWEHAVGNQIGMSDAMRNVINSRRAGYGIIRNL